MSNEEFVKEWIDLARMDLMSAKYLQKMQPIPIEIICYPCQQSVEKYLKGFLAYNKHEIVKTHDLTLLNKECCAYDADFYSIEEECLMLTDYSINIRYPYPMDLNESDMKLALKNADTIQKFVTLKIKF